MSNVISFPTRKIQLDRLIRETVEKNFGDNQPLAKCLESAANDMRDIINTINEKPPTFSFTSSGNSIQENAAGIEKAVNEMRAEYEKVISNLLTQIFQTKIAVCKLTHGE